MAIQGSPSMGKSSLLHIAAPDSWAKQGLNRADASIVFLNCFDIEPFTRNK